MHSRILIAAALLSGILLLGACKAAPESDRVIMPTPKAPIPHIPKGY